VCISDGHLGLLPDSGGLIGADSIQKDARTDIVDGNLRYVLFHLIEETARHAGHADIIRETLDGSRGL
jgi:hypothetical protein